jgi:hypothetical protein
VVPGFEKGLFTGTRENVRTLVDGHGALGVVAQRQARNSQRGGFLLDAGIAAAVLGK